MTNYHAKTKAEIIAENKTLRGMLAKAAHGPAVARLESENTQLKCDLEVEKNVNKLLRAENISLRLRVEDETIPYTLTGQAVEYVNG